MQTPSLGRNTERRKQPTSKANYCLNFATKLWFVNVTSCGYYPVI